MTQLALSDAVGALRALSAEDIPALDEESSRDWSALCACAERIAPLLLESTQDAHEIRNLTGALRGYAEMLLEVLPSPPEALQTALKQVLHGTMEPVQPGASGETGEADSVTTPPRPFMMAEEPGFILAVDDREENRELLARYLTRSGHFVVTAPGGVDALETLANADVDVVLLDRMMPGMDGREVLRRIKAEPRWRATPVIMISGEQDMQGIVECIEAGADDYLFKPFNPVLLQARIKAGIERKRWYDREQQYRDQLERNEKFIRATFGRYLSDDIVTEILERPEGLDLGGDLREVTIMMSDIRGFTTLSEQLPPDRVVSMLNRYLGAMTDIIMEYGGTIDEFLGDAILAVFGAPRRHDDDPDRAARCALAMQEAMATINGANRKDGLPELEMGIALNTGNVIAGNIGSERRSKYGFVGHAMNVTSRIEDVAQRGETLIAESTRLALGAAYALGEPREIKAPGIDEMLLVYPLERELM
ncbi:MAG: adenylate/guanylate cyclase domain-containing protein [Congregibacter sp.]